MLALLIYSCIGPDRSSDCRFSIKNNTDYQINIISYNSGVVVNNININSQNSGLECNYSVEDCYGYSVYRCNIDSLKITFPNGKGYLCSQFNNSEYWFDNNQTPFQPSEKFIISSQGVYEFTITEEDYQNAHILP